MLGTLNKFNSENAICYMYYTFFMLWEHLLSYLGGQYASTQGLRFMNV